LSACKSGANHHYVRGNEWLDLPAYYRVTISTGQQAQRYRDLPNLRPYTFFSGLPPLDRNDIARRTRLVRPAERAMAQQLLSLEGVPFYAPYASSVEQLHDIRRAGTHEVVQIQHKTLAECLEFYFVHPEWKAANPDGAGPLTRRHVRVLRHVRCGKETSRVLDDEADETDGTLVNFEEQVFAVGSMRETLRQYRVRDLMAATGLPRQTLYDLMGGAEPAPPTMETIRAGLARLASAATLSYEDHRRERREKRRAVAEG
jgi:hypothetical protein